MKKWLALLLILPVLILSACANAAVSYRLNEDNRIDIDYRMEITPDGEDISNDAAMIARYWESMDFDADVAETDDVTTLTGVKTVQCKDMEEAVNALSDILTDEDSLFYDVELRYEPSYFQDDFSLEASISLEDVLRQDDSGALPPAAAQSLLEKAAEGKYTLSIALPGEVASTNADSQDGGVCTWNLTYGEVTRIELSTSNAFSGNVAHYDMLQSALSRDNLFMTILCVVAGLALVATVLVFILRGRKRRAAAAEPSVPPAGPGAPPFDQRF